MISTPASHRSQHRSPWKSAGKGGLVMNDAPKPGMPRDKIAKARMRLTTKTPAAVTPRPKALKAREPKVTLPSAPSKGIGVTRGYMSGFGNGFETEALPGALPVGRNSPQRCAYGLYAEQVSGSPFTAPRASNQRSWLYRIRPTVAHWGAFRPLHSGLWRTAPCAEIQTPPAPMRWDPIPLDDNAQTFLQGVRTITTAGDAAAQAGMAAHVYLATRPMADEYFYNADGEMLFVPQQGALRLRTEFGIVDTSPGEIAVIPRGVKLSVELPGGPARGYVCENYGG